MLKLLEKGKLSKTQVTESLLSAKVCLFLGFILFFVLVLVYFSCYWKPMSWILCLVLNSVYFCDFWWFRRFIFVRYWKTTKILISVKVCFFLWFCCRQVVIRARNLRAGANFIPSKSFRARRAYFSNEVLIYFYWFWLVWFWVIECWICLLFVEVSKLVMLCG